MEENAQDQQGQQAEGGCSKQGVSPTVLWVIFIVLAVLATICVVKMIG